MITIVICDEGKGKRIVQRIEIPLSLSLPLSLSRSMRVRVRVLCVCVHASCGGGVRSYNVLARRDRAHAKEELKGRRVPVVSCEHEWRPPPHVRDVDVPPISDQELDDRIVTLV